MAIAVVVVLLIAGGYYAYRHFFAGGPSGGDVLPEQVAKIGGGGGSATKPPVPLGGAPSSMNHPPGSAVQGAAPQPTLPPKPLLTFEDGNVNASSSEPPHSPGQAFDGDPNTFWHADEADHQPWISVRYPSERYVTEIGMIVGRQGDWFYKNGRVKDVRLHFSSGEVQRLQFRDLRDRQTVKLRQPVLTQSVRIEITSVYHGATHHIAIPEIVVRGQAL